MNYCQFDEIGTSGQYQCKNAGLTSCNNDFTEETCHNVVSERPLVVSTTVNTTCNGLPTMTPTTKIPSVSSTTDDSTMRQTATAIPNDSVWVSTTRESFNPSLLLTLIPAMSPLESAFSTTLELPSGLLSTFVNSKQKNGSDYTMFYMIRQKSDVTFVFLGFITQFMNSVDIY